MRRFMTTIAILASAGAATAAPPADDRPHRHRGGDAAPLGGPEVGDAPERLERGQRGERGQRRERGRRFLAEIDSDGDRFISEAEIDAQVESMLSRLEEGGRALQRADANADGVLDDAELSAVEQRLRERVTKAAQRANEVHARVLEDFDADGDGALSDDERAEARNQRRERLQERRGEMRQKRTERFDADGNGEIDEQERAEARAAIGERRRGKGEGRQRSGGVRGAIRSLDADESRKLEADELAEGLRLIEAGDERFDLTRDGKVDVEDATRLIEIAERVNSREPGERQERRERRPRPE